MKSLTALLTVLSVLCWQRVSAQCCAAGGGCPVSGSTAIEALPQHSLYAEGSLQFVNSSKFLDGTEPTLDFLDRYYSLYSYYKAGYGLLPRFTVSLEAGYYHTKTQIGLDNRDTISTSGWGDLILFPRYNFLKTNGELGRFEATGGIGFKFPLGNANDTLRLIEPFSGEEYFVLKPPAIRTTTGSNDFLFYLSGSRIQYKSNLNFTASLLHMQTGWNELGEKAGNYTALRLAASKTLFMKLTPSLQVKIEHISQMRVNDGLLLYGFFNFDPFATGGEKVLLVPSLNYSAKSISVFAQSEIPVYQKLNKKQIASQYFFNAGISVLLPSLIRNQAEVLYVCPMHPAISSVTQGNCSICHMPLEKTED